MAIGPIELNGMVTRSQDISLLNKMKIISL